MVNNTLLPNTISLFNLNLMERFLFADTLVYEKKVSNVCDNSNSHGLCNITNCESFAKFNTWNSSKHGTEQNGTKQQTGRSFH